MQTLTISDSDLKIEFKLQPNEFLIMIYDVPTDVVPTGNKYSYHRKLSCARAAARKVNGRVYVKYWNWTSKSSVTRYEVKEALIEENKLAFLTKSERETYDSGDDVDKATIARKYKLRY